MTAETMQSDRIVQEQGILSHTCELKQAKLLLSHHLLLFLVFTYLPRRFGYSYPKFALAGFLADPLGAMLQCAFTWHT